MIHQPVSRGLAVFADVLAVGLACADQRKLTGNGSALEVLHDDPLYKSTTLLFTFTKAQTDKENIMTPLQHRLRRHK